jgi:hypothetical protein
MVLGPAPSASATPTADPGVGTVVADLGPVKGTVQPGFSPDGAYYAYLVAGGDTCDFRVWDLTARRLVTLSSTHAVCDYRPVTWAAGTDTLVWQVAAAGGEVTTYAWDAGSGRTSVLASDAHALHPAEDVLLPAVSADGRFLAFTGWSDAHPAPPVDDNPAYSWFVYDRTTGVSLPLSKSGVHVQFAAWGPAGHTFTAVAGGRNPYDGRSACFGSGSTCRVVADVAVSPAGPQWSSDGKAVIPEPSDYRGAVVYDFAESSVTKLPVVRGESVQYSRLVGAGGRYALLVYNRASPSLWDRKSGKVTEIPSFQDAYPSPTGKYLLTGDWAYGTSHIADLTSGSDAQRSTFSGTGGGYWTRDEAALVGIGPGGCSSLRQWSRSADTVSLFGPPAPRSCFAVPNPDVVKVPASGSGRFGLVLQRRQDGSTESLYAADLRRHVLLGPFRGYLQDEGFAPGGADVFALHQPSSDRVLLVDPTPVPDVDDEPRWSTTTPTNGASLDLTVGQQGRMTFGAWNLQQTPVTLHLRWRANAGYPVANPTAGWSCVQRRLDGGATQADCTFAPTAKHREIRYADVWATNDATGAQSDTRSYRVASRPAPAAR